MPSLSRDLLRETELDPLYTGAVVRIREIIDPEFRRRIVEALADRRGCSPAAIPEWFELDDADFVDLLNDMKEQDDAGDYLHDPRM